VAIGDLTNQLQVRISPRGAVKKQITKATYICRGAKKKVVTYFILFLFLFLFFRILLRAFFGRFVTRGVQKHEKHCFSKKYISAHHKKCGVFFLRFFFFSLGCFVRFFLSRFRAFRDKGSSKTPLKKIARKSPQLPKKVLTYLRRFFFFFFHGAP
jgi:hypothetical protein